jgi:hypothetical protein
MTLNLKPTMTTTQELKTLKTKLNELKSLRTYEIITYI